MPSLWMCDFRPERLEAAEKEYGTDGNISYYTDFIRDTAGTDYYIMYHLAEKPRGKRNADIIDVYEALDMFLPGMFAYFSLLEGVRSMGIPDLRNTPGAGHQFSFVIII